MRLEAGPFSLGVSAMGGYVTRWQWGERHLFFPEQMVRVGDKNKLRGGNPIMAPWFSKPSGRFKGLPQHGWLRGEEMQLDNSVPNIGIIKANFSLPGDEKKYPWELAGQIVHKFLDDFSLETRLELWPANERLTDFKAPVNPGFHPYFNNPAGCVVTIGKEKMKINGQGEFRKSFPMVEPIRIEMNTIGTITMKLGGDFYDHSLIFIWSDKQESYVCVEPVLRPPEVFSKGKAFSVRQNIFIEISCTFSFSNPHLKG